MEKIGKYKVHEMASRLPMMPENQYQALRDNIREQGLLNPIIIQTEKNPVIIDGRNRLKACLELNIKPQFVTLNNFLDESNKRRDSTNQAHPDTMTGLMEAEQSGDLEGVIREVILMVNVLRRHLSDFQRFLQLKAVEGYPENGQHTPSDKIGRSLSDLAKQIGWSEDKLSMANWLDKNAPEEIKEALMKNELSITTAYKEEKAKKEKKADWFDQHIEDENERLLLREAVKIKNKISKQIGILYLNEFIDIYKKVNLDNYKDTWNQ